MNFLPLTLCLLMAGPAITGCDKPKKPVPSLPFVSAPASSPWAAGRADEASGIADSKSSPGALWVQEDSGNPTQLQLIKYGGELMKKVFIKGVQNRDWEDLVLAPGPDTGVDYLYLADVGDNNTVHTSYSIYRFPEPSATTDTVYTPQKISFSYPDGSHDCEAILVDPGTRDIYLVTKRDAASRVYKLAYPQSTSATNQATLVTALSFTGAVSAAISASGGEILIKTYSNIYYYPRDPGQPIASSLQKTPLVLGYVQEPQGEAVCFKNDNTGFFTLSERSFAPSVALNFYKRQ